MPAASPAPWTFAGTGAVGDTTVSPVSDAAPAPVSTPATSPSTAPSDLWANAAPSAPDWPAAPATPWQQQPQARAPQRYTPARSDKPAIAAPISDYVRDAIAAIALLWSLSMPWDFSGDAVDRVYVVLATLLSLASLTLIHLLRLGVVPSTWGLASVRNTRRVLNAPYFLVVLAALLFDVFQDEGVGPAIGLGLAGAVLATVGRGAELPAGSDAPLWRRVAIVLGLLGVLQWVVGIGSFVYDVVDQSYYDIDSIIALLAGYFVFLLVVGAAPFFGLFRRDAAWRYVLFGAGAVIALVHMWPLEQYYEYDAMVGRLDNGSALLLLWPAVAACAAAAGFRGLEHFVADTELWFRTAAAAFSFAALVAAVLAVRNLADLSRGLGNGSDFLGNPDGTSDYVIRVAIELGVAVLSLIARGSLLRNGHGGRTTAFVVAIAQLAGATVLMVMNDGWFQYDVYSRLEVAVAYAVPLAVLALLTIPAAARGPRSSVAWPTTPRPNGYGSPQPYGTPANAYPPAGFAPTTPGSSTGPTSPYGSPAQSWQAAPDWSTAPTAGGAPSASGATSVGDEDARRAADPSAPAALLSELAANRPDLHIHIARNPSAWPELLDWIRQYGDPAAQQFLHGQQPRGY